MRKIKILWTDDEIEVLKPHILFLNEKGYEVDTCTNGVDAIDMVRQTAYDIVFLDENMPGLSGLETLKQIRGIRRDMPVVMVTKSEEEDIMEAAIGSESADYLIKPVKPKQILLAIKKILDQKRLVTEAATTDYRQEFSKITGKIGEASSVADWSDLYSKIVFRELELFKTGDTGMLEVLRMQEHEANAAFSRFVSSNYLLWLAEKPQQAPLMSHSLFQSKIFPGISNNRPLFFILIDNLRLDHWLSIAAELSGMYRISSEEIYLSILPTATQYSRNAIFAGMMPSQIAAATPGYWTGDDEEEGKNLHEEDLFRHQLRRLGISCKWSYSKVSSSADGKKVNERLKQMLQNDINIIIYNFVDILSHARTEIGLIRDLAEDEAAYRSLVRSWFLHSSLYEMLRVLSSYRIRVVITTDHGSIRVQNPVKVIGDRSTSSNLRYKNGRNLDYDAGSVFEIKDPEKAFLPRTNLTSKFIFAQNKDYLIYQNNFNHYASYYRNTFQHGGISMQEMLLPLAVLDPVS